MSLNQQTLMDKKPIGLKGLRCVSLYQWWAQLVYLNLKRIDTRSWYTPYRGQLAIQAGQKIPAYAKEKYEQSISAQNALREHCNIRRKDELCMLPTGKILAVCELVDCIEVKTDNPNLISIPAEFKTDGWQEFGIYTRGRFLWLLKDIRPLDMFVECRGYQGIWTLDSETIRKVELQLQ